jgi:hypothetical protein
MRIAIVLLLSLLWAAPQPAASMPPPLSEAALIEQSDLVARVRVISVTCTGVAKDEQSGEALPSYAAELEVLEVRKGDVEPGGVVTVFFQEIPSGVAGPWAVFYYPGEEVWTHLRGAGGGYHTTAWNARGETLHPATITKLPMVPGETARAP